MSSLSGTFSYLFVPANAESEMEQKEGDKSGGLGDDYLVKTAKNYFYQQGGGDARAEALQNATPEQRKQLATKLRGEILSSNPNAREQVDKMEDDALVDLVRSTQASPSCEIMALTVPTKGNQFHGVSMYGVDEARGRGLSLNTRASALMQACGHALPPAPDGNPNEPPGVYGDVFVGRYHDREERDIWERVDFTLADVHPSADWCTVARSSGGGGGAGKASAASLSGSLSQTLASNQQSFSENDGLNWNQTDEEVELKFSVASGTKAKYVKVQFGRDSLKVSVTGQTLVQGSTGGKVAVEDSTYTIQDDVDTGKRELSVILGKKDAGSIWPYAVRS